MRYTKRLLEMPRFGVLVVVLVGTMAGATVSCATEDAPRPSPDALEDASVPDTASDADTDAGAADVRDAGPLDASPLPVDCTGASCGVSIVAGISESFCALLQDGSVVCWGENDRAQLGRGHDVTEYGSATPAKVDGLPKITRLDRLCAIDQSGGTWCWGVGPYLRDETNGTTAEPTPVKLPIAAASSVSVRALAPHLAAVACAVADGGVVCWGSNANGQVAKPVVGDSPESGWAPHDIGIPPGAPIRSVAVGDATFALREDGTLLSWGANPPLGRVSSLFPDPRPKPISLPNVTNVDVLFDEACAVSNGAAYCWGGMGQYSAHNDPLSRALPELVRTPEPVSQVATTAVFLLSTGRRGCAVGLSGDVYCWGPNESGQAGDATKYDFAGEPVKVKGLPAPAAEVRTTPKASCALLTTGKIYCWGSNFYGQLGTGMIRTPDFTPQEVLLP